MKEPVKILMMWYAKGTRIYADRACSEWVCDVSGKQMAKHILRLHNATISQGILQEQEGADE